MAYQSNTKLFSALARTFAFASVSAVVHHSAFADSASEWSVLPTQNHDLAAGPLIIEDAGTHILSGSTSNGVVVDTEGKVRLVLDGVRVQSDSGTAIYIANADDTVIYLAEGSENYLEDASERDDEQLDGAIYSADDLFFKGAGSLEVKANFADGIVSNDDLMFSSGSYVVTSVDDGIRGKDSLVIQGGQISVVADDDGIKSTNDSDSGRGYVHILGGSISIDAEDDGITAFNSIVIDGGNIEVVRSLEGLEATNIEINAGDLSVVAIDDGINAVRNGTSFETAITVNGGNIDVTVDPGDTDAFDSNGAMTVTGGNINITAPTSAFDFDGYGQMTGGKLFVNGEELTSLPEGRRGRGNRGRDRDSWFSRER